MGRLLYNCIIHAIVLFRLVICKSHLGFCISFSIFLYPFMSPNIQYPLDSSIMWFYNKGTNIFLGGGINYWAFSSRNTLMLLQKLHKIITAYGVRWADILFSKMKNKIWLRCYFLCSAKFLTLLLIFLTRKQFPIFLSTTIVKALLS